MSERERAPREDWAGTTVEADLTWTGESFESSVRVGIGTDGRVDTVEKPEDPGPVKVRRLRGKALLPGFVNTHSHAFQRGLRGRGETFPSGAGSFWTWREEMYRLVQRLDRQSFHDLCVRAFCEMRAAGITTVGEFHYLHHEDAAARDGTFDEVVLDAAAEVGLRIVLLQTFYATGGVGRELLEGQQRFATPDLEEYWYRVDRLGERIERTTERTADGGERRLQSLGAVAHSLRAAGPDQVVSLYGQARRRDLPFHMHVEEQRWEIEDCVEKYGKRPMELLLDELEVTSTFTAVHCTHTPVEDLARFVAAGGNVCVCPLTEANLGDGLPTLTPDQDPDAPSPAAYRLSLGTDSNARISMLEEMRWLEYGQRLKTESRGILREDEGSVSRTLLEAATRGGARALNLPVGDLEPGNWADMTAIDLEHPDLAETEPKTLLDALVFGCSNEVIAGTCVGGRWEEKLRR